METLGMVNAAFRTQTLTRSNVLDGMDVSVNDEKKLKKSGWPTECRSNENVEKILQLFRKKPSPYTTNASRGEISKGTVKKTL